MLRGGLSGSVALEPVGPNRTRLRFRESFHMTTPVLRWFEGPIYRFINRKNEESMRGAAAWLAAHPEFHPELNDPLNREGSHRSGARPQRSRRCAPLRRPAHRLLPTSPGLPPSAGGAPRRRGGIVFRGRRHLRTARWPRRSTSLPPGWRGAASAPGSTSASWRRTSPAMVAASYAVWGLGRRQRADLGALDGAGERRGC